MGNFECFEPESKDLYFNDGSSGNRESMKTQEIDARIKSVTNYSQNKKAENARIHGILIHS